MKTIGELTQEFQTPKEPDISIKLAEFINDKFKRLVSICPAWKAGVDGDPNAWADGYKIELVRELKSAGVTNGEQIDRGINEYRKLGRPFFPSPGEFAQLCMGTTDKHNTAAYRLLDRSKLLGKPKAKQEIAQRYIEKMREML